MKNYTLKLLFLIIPFFGFAQNGGELCNQDTAQLRYYKGFYQRTAWISSSTYNAKMGDVSYKSAFYWLALPSNPDATTVRTFSVDACTFRGSLHLGEGSVCTEITQLDANRSCSSAPGVRTYYTGIPADKTYVIEFNTKGRGGIDEDGGENLIWSWKFNGPEACDTPSVTEVTVDYTTNNATIAFTDRDGSAPSGTYEVYLLSEHDETETVDLPLLGNPTKTVFSSPFTLTNLTPNTNYRLWMSKSCANGMGSGFSTDEITYIDTTDQSATAGGTVCDAIVLNVGVKANPYDQNMHSSAYTETDEPQASCHSGSAYQSMWFTFVAPPSGNVRISTDTETPGAVTDTEIALYAQPSSCSDLTTFGAALACDTDSGVHGDGNLSIIEHTGLTPGETYYIQVLAFEGGSYGIEVLEQVGDESSEAPIINIDNVAVEYNMSSATLSSATNGCSVTALKDAWVKFVSPSSGNVLLELITNNDATAYLELYDFVNDVYTALGICVSSSLDIDVAEQTSSSSGFRPLNATTELTSGKTYYVRIVQEDGSAFTSFSLKASNPSTLGIKEIENKGLVMYPNPFQNEFFISSSELPIKTTVYDLTGKEILKLNPKKESFSGIKLESGVYLLKVHFAKKTIVKKIIRL